MSMRSMIVVLCGLLATAFASPELRAAQILYELSGSADIRFSISTNPVAPAIEPDGFVVKDVQVEIDGVMSTRDVGFVLAARDGGLIIVGTPFDLAGSQLFSGPTTAPTMLAGNFALRGFSDKSLSFSLKATDLGAPAVPEPGTWLLMLAGFFAIGMAMRARRPAASKLQAT